jgi:hypothetical protein
LKVEPVAITPPPRVDAVIIQAFHAAYRDLDLSDWPGLRAVLDGRGALAGETAASLRRRGIRYLRIGLGKGEDESGSRG